MKRLYVLCDMEGASGISPSNAGALRHGSALWHAEGRACVTSDVQAVCEAARASGIESIILNDSHDNGKREPNVLVGQLPDNVRSVPRPYLPGKPRRMAGRHPLGVIIVGQHARYGGGGFAPHTIQSPPIGTVTLNGIEIGEIGIELALFMDVPLLAIIGERAAVDEALELVPTAMGIGVKSLEQQWFPTPAETRGTILEGVARALTGAGSAEGVHFDAPYRFTLAPADGWRLQRQPTTLGAWLSKQFLQRIAGGRLSEGTAEWTTRSVVRGLYALHAARGLLAKRI
jgi:D-aminopeptidase